MGVDAATERSLWARGVIPTHGMRLSVYQGGTPAPRAGRSARASLRRSSTAPIRAGPSPDASRSPTPAAPALHAGRMRRLILRSACLALVCLALVVSPAPAAGAPDPEQRIDTAEVWLWPISGGVRVIAPWVAPAHRYGPGHRGLDLAGATGSAVLAPASGVVAFRGRVVDRPLLTIDHGGGLVSTLEPVTSDLSPGDVVSRGQVVGEVAAGGHAVAGSLHLGVRLDGEYVNPLLLLGGIPRAILLPCC